MAKESKTLDVLFHDTLKDVYFGFCRKFFRSFAERLILP